MKTYLIASPAYRANGNHGTYYSIAICEDNGDFKKIIGDHSFDGKTIKGYINVDDVIGIPFSDADRFIAIREININEQILTNWEQSYTKFRLELNEWEKRRLAICNGDSYAFLYDKKGKSIKENKAIYDNWMKENPCPTGVSYYDFLKAIIHEN